MVLHSRNYAICFAVSDGTFVSSDALIAVSKTTESLTMKLAPGGVRICCLHASADVDEAALRAGELIFLLPEQFTVRSVDKMKPVTRLADHRFVGRRRVLGLRLVQPMLHVQTGMRTFENDITHKPAISDGFRPLWS